MEALGLVLLKSAAWLTGFCTCLSAGVAQRTLFQAQQALPADRNSCFTALSFYTFHYTVVIPSIQTGSAMVDGLIPGGVISEETSLPFYFWIYLAGIIVVLLRLFFQTWKIIRKLKETGYEQRKGLSNWSVLRICLLVFIFLTSLSILQQRQARWK